MMPGEWMALADCRNDDTFLDRDVWEQIDTCHDCPVRRECYAFGKETKADDVVYGGVLMRGPSNSAARRRIAA